MAESLAKADVTSTDAAQAGHNSGMDPERLKHLVDFVEEQEQKIASIMGEAMAQAKAHRGHISDALKDAKKAHGVPVGELRAVIKVRSLERKAKAARDDLDLAERETFDQIRHAIGDLEGTPLGDAAVAKAEAPAEEPAAEAEPEENAFEENVVPMNGGDAA